MAVAFLGTHVPLLTLLLTFVVSHSYSWETAIPVLVIALVATLIGTAATLYALHHLLIPVILTSTVLQDYLDTKTLPELPTDFEDEAGTLMANTSQTLHQLDELIHYIRHYDNLTGLPNRDLFCDRLYQTLSPVPNQPRLVAVLMVGIDDFTGVSHAWQPETANLLLRAMAQRLTTCLSSTETLAHLSEDQFAIALTDLPCLETVVKLSQLILSTLAKPFALEGGLIRITASVGITINELGERQGVEPLLQQAHMALYRAQQQGRGQYQFYCPEIAAQLQDRLALENELYGALERQEMRVYYQPLIDLQSGELTAVEALVRWQHPTLGLVSPAKFIPIAEANGLIVPLGEWVLRTACAQSRAWQLAGFPAMRMSVNLSARQLEQPNLVDMIRQVLVETGLEAAYLELEVTESALMVELERSIDTLKQLQGLGILLALDDFGTGYSSLNYLKQFPVSLLKIDRSFVQDILSNPDSAAVSDAIIALAKSLRLSITAEGIETEEQLDYLRQRGCHEGQGFYFSRPVPAAKLTQMLESCSRQIQVA
ncbi:bifunctional diguanylate cyclase/phosphodiesterase [Trichocoleus sp. FACHB-262]|uniref:putative bifunctional diguanylate cyclase/phosphodiesterase n=1 Tax=Trichocoleus sp. FACHB-262 TaxID=2692869 RepID=UPI0018F04DB8|nr:bifunctional diguanylate cyclase/phosphodiesterase [Trichocoleus sp. FACHB-262]